MCGLSGDALTNLYISAARSSAMDALLRRLDRVLAAQEVTSSGNDFNLLGHLRDPDPIERLCAGESGKYDVDMVEEIISIEDVRVCQGLRSVRLSRSVDFTNGCNISRDNLTDLCRLVFPSQYHTYEFITTENYISVNVKNHGKLVAVIGAGYLNCGEGRVCYICSFQFQRHEGQQAPNPSTGPRPLSAAEFFARNEFPGHDRYGFNSIRRMAYALCHSFRRRFDEYTDTVYFRNEANAIRPRVKLLEEEMLMQWKIQCLFALDSDDVELLKILTHVRNINLSIWRTMETEFDRNRLLDTKRQDMAHAMNDLRKAFSILFNVEWLGSCMNIRLSSTVTCVLEWAITRRSDGPRLSYTVKVDQRVVRQSKYIVFFLIDLVGDMKRTELKSALEKTHEYILYGFDDDYVDPMEDDPQPPPVTDDPVRWPVDAPGIPRFPPEAPGPHPPVDNATPGGPMRR
jgi:hypothetical protein